MSIWKMRDSSVFTFLKPKFGQLYDLCQIMEKLIVVKKYRLAMATAKVLLDLFCKLTENQLILTFDVFNDRNMQLNERSMKSVHKLLFKYIYEDYFEEIEESLQVDYEFDFSYLGHNPKITNEDIYLILNNLEVYSIKADLAGFQGEDIIFVEDLSSQDKINVLNLIKENLDYFIKNDVLTLNLFDSEGYPLTRKLNFEAQLKSDRCVLISSTLSSSGSSPISACSKYLSKEISFLL